MRTYQFKIVISRNSLYIFHTTLLQSLDKISRKRDSIFHLREQYGYGRYEGEKNAWKSLNSDDEVEPRNRER